MFFYNILSVNFVEMYGFGGGPPRNRTELQGFAVLCITNLPAGQR